MVWMVWLLACSNGKLTEKNYGERYAPLICKAQEECTKLYFNEYYSDIPDCVDEVIDEYEDDLDRYDDCDFESNKAERCLESLKEFAKTCEYRDLGDECDDDIGGVAVEVLSSPVVDRGRARVGVAGRELDIT
jgi:hypothetical protein